MLASGAQAHDRHGNATMNQDVLVTIDKGAVEVTFQIETNEEGRTIEAITIDTNADGKLSPGEQSAYFARLDARLRDGLYVSMNGRSIALRPAGEVTLAPPAKKVFRFQGDLDPAASFPAHFEIHNDNFPDWPGTASLKVEPGAGLIIKFLLASTTFSAGSIRLSSKPDFGYRSTMNWRQWSWIQRLLSPLIMTAAAIIFGAIASIIMLTSHRSLIQKGIGAILVTASLASLYAASLKRGAPPTTSQVWVSEFRAFHLALSHLLTSYHHDGDAKMLASLGTHDAMARLIGATRVVAPGDEKSGTFELHRVRPLDTSILEEPRYPLSPTLRIRHTWRAVGVVRHDGHPHERTRNFTCDYTLRVTHDGFRILYCSEWHQLPDEPVE